MLKMIYFIRKVAYNIININNCCLFHNIKSIGVSFMSLLKKLELANHFSSSEKSIASYILNNTEEVLNLSTIELAKKTYTSPATIVRLCQKLDFKGYNDFKIALSANLQYILSHQKNINANFPFQKNTNLSHISNTIAKLYKESIDETLQLINEDILRKSVILLDNAKVIDIYGVSGPLRIASDFQYKMFRIGKDVRIAPMVNEQLFQAAQSKADHCAILVSYSGETEEVIKAAQILKQKQIPMIAITSIGDNQLTKYCQYILNIDSREQIYNKISTLGSTLSIHLVFDILYTAIFSRHYDEALSYKITTDQLIDHRTNK